MNRRTFLGLIAAAVVIHPIAKPTLETHLSFTSARLEVGDVITIGGQYVFNPLTRQPTSVLRKYVVTSVAPYVLGLRPH